MIWGREKLCCIQEEEMKLLNRTSLFIFLRLNTWPLFPSFCRKQKYCLWSKWGRLEVKYFGQWNRSGVLQKKVELIRWVQFSFQFNFSWKKTLHVATNLSSPEQFIFHILVLSVWLCSLSFIHLVPQIFSPEMHFPSDCLTPHYVLGSNCAPKHWCKVLFWISCHVLNFHKDMWADVLDVTIWWYNYQAENSSSFRINTWW